MKWGSSTDLRCSRTVMVYFRKPRDYRVSKLPKGIGLSGILQYTGFQTHTHTAQRALVLHVRSCPGLLPSGSHTGRMFLAGWPRPEFTGHLNCSRSKYEVLSRGWTFSEPRASVHRSKNKQQRANRGSLARGRVQVLPITVFPASDHSSTRGSSRRALVAPHICIYKYIYSLNTIMINLEGIL